MFNQKSTLLTKWASRNKFTYMGGCFWSGFLKCFYLGLQQSIELCPPLAKPINDKIKKRCFDEAYLRLRYIYTFPLYTYNTLSFKCHYNVEEMINKCSNLQTWGKLKDVCIIYSHQDQVKNCFWLNLFTFKQSTSLFVLNILLRSGHQHKTMH